MNTMSVVDFTERLSQTTFLLIMFCLEADWMFLLLTYYFVFTDIVILMSR